MVALLVSRLPEEARQRLKREHGEYPHIEKFLLKVLDTPYEEWEKIGAGWLKEYFVEDEE